MVYVTNGKQTYGVADIQLSPFLQAGFRIVESKIEKPKKIEPVIEPVVEEVIEAEPVQIHEEQEIEKQFTRTEINRLPISELKKVAKSLGLPVNDESTGSKLKASILGKLRL